MVAQLCFFGSIVFSLVAWGVVLKIYIWPELELRKRADALRPLLVLHSFRFIGLAFLVPGVVALDLPASFSRPAAYGDILAATLALITLLALPTGAGTISAWVFNLWGSADLLNAFYQAGHAGLKPGQLGATYFLPTLIVPLLFLTHLMGFRLLLRRQKEHADSQVLLDLHHQVGN